MSVFYIRSAAASCVSCFIDLPTLASSACLFVVLFVCVCFFYMLHAELCVGAGSVVKCVRLAVSSIVFCVSVCLCVMLITQAQAK